MGGLKVRERERMCVCETVNWIHLAQDKAQLRAFVNTVKNISVP